MAQPNIESVHVNAPLSNISIAYIQNATNFVASRAFPIVPVNKQADIIPLYTKNDWFRDEAQLRLAGAESAGGGYNIDTSNTYYCHPYAYHKDVSDMIRGNADSYMSLDREASLWVTQKLLVKREVNWAADNFAISKWDKDYTGVSTGASAGTSFIQWSDYGSSDPINDISVGRTYVLSKTGFEPNVMVIGHEAFEQLKNHPDIVDRYKYTTSSSITAEMVAKIFELDEILVGKAIKATNEEGAADATGFINGKAALLLYRPASPGLYTPSAGYTFTWKGLTSSNDAGFMIETLRAPLLKCDRIEGHYAFDIKLTASDLGVFFTSAVA